VLNQNICEMVLDLWDLPNLTCRKLITYRTNKAVQGQTCRRRFQTPHRAGKVQEHHSGFMCSLPSTLKTEATWPSGMSVDVVCRMVNKTNFVALSPQAIYTEWATSTCLRNLVPPFTDRGVSRGQRGRSHTAVNRSFLDRRRYFYFK
jgi:hypothetical protein